MVFRLASRLRIRKNLLISLLISVFLIYIYVSTNKKTIIYIDQSGEQVKLDNPNVQMVVTKNLPSFRKYLDNSLINAKKVQNLTLNYGSDKYILKLSKERINRLFKKLNDKEKIYASILNKLNLISFDELIKNERGNNEFKNEINEFLEVNGNNLEASDKFIEYLYKQSDEHTFKSPRNIVNKAQITKNKEKIAIVTAANSGYYDPLQATVFHVHKHFPDLKLIVYDLGLTGAERKKTEEKCKCEVRSFDADKMYSSISEHVNDLKTYSWKPLIVAEALKSFDTVLYIDSSIRFHSNEIQPVIDSCEKVGLLTQYIGLKLLCYTNPKMFDWFGENRHHYESFNTIEANIIMFHKSFLTSLMVKAWVTCALDKDCIAPVGSTISGCCGCHRFDQDGLTIIAGFFIGHPKNEKQFLPAHSFTTAESYFFEIRRYEGMKYFE